MTGKERSKGRIKGEKIERKNGKREGQKGSKIINHKGRVRVKEMERREGKRDKELEGILG